ncbi:hypothetical protein AOLI_G00045650 [Acnodon oligacanthus]
MRGTLLRYYHDHPTAGHLGVTKTLARLRLRFFWPKMASDVKMYVLSCSVCQLTKPSQRKPAGLMAPINPERPWEYVGVDFVGPLPRTSCGNVHIIVFLDYFSKWVEINAVREATAQVAASKFLSEVFARHGAPKYLISDEEHPLDENTGLQRHIIRKQMQLSGTSLKLSPYSGLSPSLILYGREIETPLDLITQPSCEGNEEPDIPYPERLRSSLKEEHDHARAALETSQKRHKHYYDLKRRPVSYQLDDLVRVKTHPRSDAVANFTAKLAPVYCGPYRITQKLSDVTYRLNKVVTGQDAGVFHVVNLQPYRTWDTADTSKLTWPHVECSDSRNADDCFISGHSGSDQDSPDDVPAESPSDLFGSFGDHGQDLPDPDSATADLTLTDPVIEPDTPHLTQGPLTDCEFVSDTFSQYNFRPRRVPRVTSGWSTSRWTNPYHTDRKNL